MAGGHSLFLVLLSPHWGRGERLALVWCLGISLSLTGRMWLRYPADHWIKKLGWTFVLFVPFFGWVFYGAFYRPLPPGDVPCPKDADDSWGAP